MAIDAGNIDAYSHIGMYYQFKKIMKRQRNIILLELKKVIMGQDRALHVITNMLKTISKKQKNIIHTLSSYMIQH